MRRYTLDDIADMLSSVFPRTEWPGVAERVVAHLGLSVDEAERLYARMTSHLIPR